jgi:hypothetical protein
MTSKSISNYFPKIPKQNEVQIQQKQQEANDGFDELRKALE